jgi:hypothetical protein
MLPQTLSHIYTCSAGIGGAALTKRRTHLRHQPGAKRRTGLTAGAQKMILPASCSCLGGKAEVMLPKPPSVRFESGAP